MRRHLISCIVAAIAALALSVPAVGFAAGGVSHSTKPCSAHRHSGEHNGTGGGKGRHRGAGKGEHNGIGGGKGEHKDAGEC